MRISFNNNRYTNRNINNTNKTNKQNLQNPSFGLARPVVLESKFANFLKNQMEDLKILPKLKQAQNGWLKESDCDIFTKDAYMPKVAEELIVSRRQKHPNMPRLHTWWRLGAENDRICRLDFSVKKTPIRIKVELERNGDNIVHINALEKADTPYEYKITEFADGSIERLERKNSEWIPIKKQK